MAIRTERDMELAIASAAKEMKQDDARAARSRAKWELLLHEGNTKFGVTYDRCADLSKLSRSRIDQVLRKIRNRKKESNHASV